MADILEEFDKKLLGLLQTSFPLVEEPYAELGRQLGTTNDEVIRHIRRLKARGIVRQISPVINVRKLGYQSTLVALKVQAEKMPDAEQALLAHPGVSHGYVREHEFNVWLTLSLPREISLDDEVSRLIEQVGAEDGFHLPALQVFKLRAIFNESEDMPVEPGNNPGVASQKASLTEQETAVLNALQQPLPLSISPFALIAAAAGVDVAALLTQTQSLLEKGVIRRYGAAVNHRKAGYDANAMACWKVSPDKLVVVAEKLAALREVSHCYERQTNPLWQYNLFAMVHGQTRQDCLKIIYKISEESGIRERIVLFSVSELKKARIRITVGADD